MTVDVRHGPSRSDAFLVELEGLAVAGFSRCLGLERSRAAFVYHEGGAERPTCLLAEEEPVRLRLERGLSTDRTLWDWFDRGDSRDGAVLLLDTRGREQERWSFRDAVPVRCCGPSLDAGDDAIALEAIELVCSTLARGSIGEGGPR